MLLRFEINLDDPNIEGATQFIAAFFSSAQEVFAAGMWSDDVRTPEDETGQLRQAEILSPGRGPVCGRLEIVDEAFDTVKRIERPVQTSTVSDPTNLTDVTESTH